MKEGDLWNVNALKTKAGKLLLQVYDWDVAGWVRGPSTGRPAGRRSPITSS